MKKLIAVAIVALSVSATAGAASCQVIAEGIAESFVKAYNLPKTDGYAQMVKVQKESCEQGVLARKNGLTAAQLAQTSAATYRSAQHQLKTDEAILGFAMANLSATSGFTYGE